MKILLSSINVVVECRDYRIPLSSRNPLFESSLTGRERLIVHTKQDLGSEDHPEDRERERIIRGWHHPTPVAFTNKDNQETIKQIVDFAKDHAKSADSLTGTKILIIGMPNVGKSSLLNAVRKQGMNMQRKFKAAYVMAQPGTTKKITTQVKIVEGTEERGPVYVMDTPGVFMPYVPNSETMLKLALCSCVPDNFISHVTLADYLLYKMNLYDHNIYGEYSYPTNDIIELLDNLAQRAGKLARGGGANYEAAALWLVQRWRMTKFGRFMLDEVADDSFEKAKREYESMDISLHQAKKAEKETRKKLAAEHRLAV